MNAIVLKAKKQPYLIFAIFAIVVALAALMQQLQGFLKPNVPKFTWQVISGTALVIVISYQWFLLYLRQTQRTKQMRFHYLAHRWIGVMTVLLFAFHAISAGHMWTSALVIVFILTAITGVLNREIISYPKHWMYLTWFWVHISLSFIMLPLIAVHIWVALLYQGS
ncbi:hypothetical protein F9L33_10480 [Amylibacter sp. SFDW26]|uniref:hypothetical protein n=1 Tax=Amylibacter sp. SFDW26 TaxID=2652722 RepID=UPI00126188DF|nr:hypothetical protein [Amylibacter sp. SFDW26]KAB7613787.1 hypothetical protein F9L33_10480 [Amylibacter sp. SFDW26]